jgi:c-di-AMP phosphodiesterase-like protein
MDAYQTRSKIVASATLYRRCAIAVCNFPSEDIRIVCAQAADELLNISGVDAAVVLFQTGDIVNISARSMGAMNVQVLMEKMGGGGHHTMAAAQVRDTTIEQVKQDVMRYIDAVYQ